MTARAEGKNFQTLLLEATADGWYGGKGALRHSVSAIKFWDTAK